MDGIANSRTNGATDQIDIYTHKKSTKIALKTFCSQYKKQQTKIFNQKLPNTFHCLNFFPYFLILLTTTNTWKLIRQYRKRFKKNIIENKSKQNRMKRISYFDLLFLCIIAGLLQFSCTKEWTWSFG